MRECRSFFGSRKAGRCVWAILGLAALALPVGALAREPVQTQNGLLLPADAGEAGVEVFKSVHMLPLRSGISAGSLPSLRQRGTV